MTTDLDLGTTMEKKKDANILFFAFVIALVKCCDDSRSRFEDVDFDLYIPDDLVRERPRAFEFRMHYSAGNR